MNPNKLMNDLESFACAFEDCDDVKQRRRAKDVYKNVISVFDKSKQVPMSRPVKLGTVKHQYSDMVASLKLYSKMTNNKKYSQESIKKMQESTEQRKLMFYSKLLNEAQDHFKADEETRIKYITIVDDYCQATGMPFPPMHEVIYQPNQSSFGSNEEDDEDEEEFEDTREMECEEEEEDFKDVHETENAQDIDDCKMSESKVEGKNGMNKYMKRRA